LVGLEFTNASRNPHETYTGKDLTKRERWL
jgi:hypothetical protein